MNNRSINLDVIRILAFLFVVSVHSFTNLEWYQQTISNSSYFPVLILRDFFIICVPLFMLISGYLLKNRKFSIEHYKKIFKVIIIYIIASIIVILFRKYYLNESFNFTSIVLNILNFKGAPYAWYIEMYIGLFLLVPFLNIIYDSLKTKQNRKWLILIMIFLTILPNILNIKYKIVPGYWVNFYPVTYYFVGAYLRDYKIEIKTYKKILFLIIFLLLFGLFEYFVCKGKIFNWSIYNTYNGLPFITACIVFDLLVNVNFKRVSNKLSEFLKKCSSVTLGAYLVSYIFDSFIYKLFDNISFFHNHIIIRGVISIIVVFIFSIILSMLIQLLYNGLRKLNSFLINLKN